MPKSVSIVLSPVWFSAFFFTCLLIWQSSSNVLAQEDANGRPLAVGNLVEVAYLGQTIRGEILEFSPGNWPKIEFEYKGEKITRTFPDRRVTLVQSTDESALKSELRTWTDSTGKFKVEAKLVGLEEDKVELEKKDGRFVTLPIDRLSDDDKEFVKKLEAEAMAETDKDNPFAGGTSEPSSSTGGNAGGAGMALLPPIQVDCKANEIALVVAESNVTPDPAVISYDVANKILRFQSTLKSPSLIELGRTFGAFSPDGKTLSFVVNTPFEPNSEIFTADLEAGTISSPLRIPFKGATAIAVSDGGKMVVTARNGKGGVPGSMDFWKLEGEKLVQTASWETVRSTSVLKPGGFATPSRGQFIDDNRLLTLGARTVLWDVEKATPIFSVTASNSTSVQLTPGKNQIVLSLGDEIFVIDVETGKPVGKLLSPVGPMTRLAVSPNGRFLAGVQYNNNEIYIWDLATQKLIDQFGMISSANLDITWCGDRHILCDKRVLIDVPLQTSVWQYNSEIGSLLSESGRFWFLGQSAITPIQLPESKLEGQTKSLDPDDLMVLYPGVELSLRLDVALGASNVESIRKKLTESLEKSEFKVVDNANLELVCEIKKLDPKTITVSDLFSLRPFGRGGNEEKITFTPTILSMALKRDGKSVWRRTKQFAPVGIIQVEKDETTQQAADRLCKPQFSFFGSQSIPKNLSLLPDGNFLGTSKFTQSGIR